MTAGLGHLPLLHHHDGVGVGPWSRAGGRSRWWCGRGKVRRSLPAHDVRTRCRAPAVASSSRIMGAFLISARAIDTRWRCPPYNCRPCCRPACCNQRESHDEIMRVCRLLPPPRSPHRSHRVCRKRCSRGSNRGKAPRSVRHRRFASAGECRDSRRCSGRGSIGAALDIVEPQNEIEQVDLPPTTGRQRRYFRRPATTTCRHIGVHPGDRQI